MEMTRKELYLRMRALEAALEPFSEACVDSSLVHDTEDFDIWEHAAAMNITTNHLRAAHKVMEARQ